MTRLKKKTMAYLVVAVIIVLPFVITIKNAVFSADDFSMINLVGHNGPLWIEAAKACANLYKTFAGLTPYYYIQFVFNPILLFGLDKVYMVGVELTILFIIFIVVLFFYVKEGLRCLLGERGFYNAALLFPVVLLCILNSDIYNEIFYWYTGSTYLVGIIFMMLNQIAIHRYIEGKPGWKTGFVVALVGFVACAMYHLAVFSGVVYVLLMLKNKESYKSIRSLVKGLIPLAFMIIGGALSAFAPGNMARRDSIQAPLSVGNALVVALKNEIRVFGEVLKNPVYLLLIVICILLGNKYIVMKIQALVCGLLGMFVSVTGFLFPVALGYANSDLPSRLMFCVKVEIVFWTCLIAVVAGGVVRCLNKLISETINRRGVWIMTAFIAIILGVRLGGYVGGTYTTRSDPWLYTLRNMNNVSVESAYYKGILNEIKESDQTRVELWRDGQTFKTGILKGLELSDDENSWFNVTTAKAYGKDCVVLKEGN